MFLKYKILLIFMFCNIVMVGQQNKEYKCLEYDKLITLVVNKTDQLLNCNDSNNNTKFSSIYFIIIRKSTDKREIILSIEPFPIWQKYLNKLNIVGLYKINNSTAIIASEKSEFINLPGIITLDIERVYDSLTSINEEITETSITFFYNYIFKYKSSLINKNIGKLTYQFYSNYNCVPPEYRILAQFPESKRKYSFQIESTEFDIFKINCQRYLYLSENERKELFHGEMKVTLNN